MRRTGRAAWLLRGDARALPLADRSVQCVVTSPPYWGLRDYGTATWVGGRRGCAHGVRRWDGAKQTQGAQSGHAAQADRLGRDVCGRCGARRVDAQLGMEATPDRYVAALVAVFRDVRRVLADDGVCWLNLGDSYANDTKWGGATSGKHVGALHGQTGIGRAKRHTGLKPKDLALMPARVALALQADGWYLRADVIWHKPNPMPESVTDRPTRAHEHLFLLAKSARYAYDAAAIAERAAQPIGRARLTGQHKADAGGFTTNGRGASSLGSNSGAAVRNRRSVWTVATQAYRGAHFATMPEKLVTPCILAGCRPGGVVLDPFVGSGTVVAVAQRLGRRGVGLDLRYQDLARVRCEIA